MTHENLFIAVCLLVVSFLYHAFLFLKRIKAQTNIQNFKMKTSGKFSGKMFVFFWKATLGHKNEEHQIVMRKISISFFLKDGNF